MTVVCIKCRRRYQLAEGQSLTGCACECGGKLYAEDDPALYQVQPEPQPSGEGKVIACPDCGGKVSRRAPACPHCGAPLKSAAAPTPTPTIPIQANGRIKVDTGENALTRNRGCADLLIFIPAALLIIFLVYFLIKSMN